ncbi:interferon-induced protein 44-like isoform X2 [Xiphophorus hellerii]|uniref:interferon-induced protein 44-like isoform X2 n=1 Tax=Xiphophorus hellerii TaxID=8084 RepID=UPI0013B36667|nr:interferon-induced protein 44-like isoform X2 [Xiphophorus hellerii]
MNSKLSETHQKAICSQLGHVQLKLLYKASVHGYTAAAFHQQCDSLSPTLSVGYNASGYIFGGYTTQPFDQSGQYAKDDQAFLFTFMGRKLIKYPVANASYAVRMMSNSGPYFGESLVLINTGMPVVHSEAASYYPFNAAQMHGNDLNLIECEVYQLVELTKFEDPWRTVTWNLEHKLELMNYIENYKPQISSVSQARVLLVGPVGVGKSSFFNSINSVFRGHVTNQAMSGCSSTSLTTQAGREGRLLPVILCDTMGLEGSNDTGLDIEDITSILKGHLPDRYQFNPATPLDSDASGYCKSPSLKDKIHCVTYVLDACNISIMSAKMEEKLGAIRKKANQLRIPQLVVLTKVDEACFLVKEDLTNIYQSIYLKETMQQASAKLGIPLSCIVPVRNYTETLDLDVNCDILLLSALTQMLRSADNFYDDFSDQLSTLQTRE